MLEISKTKLGVDHPSTLSGMNNLAHTWKDLGRDEDAIQLMRDCVEGRGRVLDVQHPNYISSY